MICWARRAGQSGEERRCGSGAHPSPPARSPVHLALDEPARQVEVAHGSEFNLAGPPMGVHNAGGDGWWAGFSGARLQPQLRLELLSSDPCAWGAGQGRGARERTCTGPGAAETALFPIGARGNNGTVRSGMKAVPGERSSAAWDGCISSAPPHCRAPWLLGCSTQPPAQGAGAPPGLREPLQTAPNQPRSPDPRSAQPISGRFHPRLQAAFQQLQPCGSLAGAARGKGARHWPRTLSRRPSKRTRRQWDTAWEAAAATHRRRRPAATTAGSTQAACGRPAEP